MLSRPHVISQVTCSWCVSSKLEHPSADIHIEFVSLLASMYLVSESNNPEAVLNCFKLSPVRLLGSDVLHDSSSLSRYVSEQSGTWTNTVSVRSLSKQHWTRPGETWASLQGCVLRRLILWLGAFKQGECWEVVLAPLLSSCIFNLTEWVSS